MVLLRREGVDLTLPLQLSLWVQACASLSPPALSALPDEELRGRRTAVPNTIESSVGAGSC